MTASRINGLVEEALHGSGRAANELAEFYFEKPQVSRYWIMIGAENGDATSQYNYWFTLSRDESANALSRERAIFWLRKAAAQGHPIARAELAQLERNPRPP
jgi:TPR repeat protein